MKGSLGSLIISTILFVSTSAIISLQSCGRNNPHVRDTDPTRISGLKLEFDSINISEGFHSVSLFFTNEKTGFLGSVSGSIFRTNDSGLTWIKLKLPVKEKINALYFFNSKEGIAAGQSILKTTDSGNTWSIISHFDNTKEILAVNFINDSVGFAGGNNILMKSVDRGSHWTEIVSHGITYTINQIYFCNDTLGFISNGENGLLKINGFGLSKVTKVSGIPVGNLKSVSGFKGNSVYFLIDNNLYRSDDLGSNWLKISSVPKVIATNSLIEISNSQSLIFGEGDISGGENWHEMYGYIGYSVNSGQTWIFDSRVSECGYILSACQVSSNKIFAIANRVFIKVIID